MGQDIIVKVNDVRLICSKKIMDDTETIALDSTVRSQNSSHSKESKDSVNSELKPESYLESKHSKDVLIPEKQELQQQQLSRRAEDQQDLRAASEIKDDSNLLMFTSCGQLLLGNFQYKEFPDNFNNYHADIIAINFWNIIIFSINFLLYILYYIFIYYIYIIYNNIIYYYKYF